MGRLHFFFSLFSGLLLLSCTQQGQSSGGAVELDEPKVYFTVEPATAYVQPTLEPEVQNPANGVVHSNLIGKVLRGTRIDVTKIENGFAYGRWILGANGWLPMLSLIPGDSSALATCAVPLARLNAPGAGEPDGEIQAGTLLILLEQNGAYSRVNYDGRHDAWVVTASLLLDTDNIGVSRLIDKMRFSHANGEVFGATYELFEEAKTSFPESKLLERIEIEAEEIRLAKEAACPEKDAAPQP